MTNIAATIFPANLDLARKIDREQAAQQQEILDRDLADTKESN